MGMGGQAAPPSQSKAITEEDGQRWRRLAKDAHRAAENSGQAVSLLSDMLQPTEGENAQLSEVTALLTTMAEMLARMEERLSAIESRLPALRLVSDR